MGPLRCGRAPEAGPLAGGRQASRLARARAQPSVLSAGKYWPAGATSRPPPIQGHTRRAAPMSRPLMMRPGCERRSHIAPGRPNLQPASGAPGARRLAPPGLGAAPLQDARPSGGSAATAAGGARRPEGVAHCGWIETTDNGDAFRPGPGPAGARVPSSRVARSAAPNEAADMFGRGPMKGPGRIWRQIREGARQH